MTLRTFLARFAERFQLKQTTTWAASLAFYTSLSLAPLLVLFLSLTSQMGSEFQKNFFAEIHSVMGPEAASGLEMILQNTKSRTDLRSLSSLLSIFALLVSASLIFGELRAALNNIFERPETQSPSTLWQATLEFIKDRVLQMGLVLGFLLTMITSLIISAFISNRVHTGEGPGGLVVNYLTSLLIYVILFTCLFKYVPHRSPGFREVLLGGVVTAFLFVGGKELIGLYLGNSAISSSYGAAGALVLLLVWVYYSALILFVGAHLSYIFWVKDQPQPSAVA